jgi:predicted transposase YdaD
MLIQHHGDSILRLGGIQEPFSWRAVQPEVVQPRKLPDGLIEVKFAGESEADLFVLEIATYPDAQLFEQILRDSALVFSDRRVLPEIMVLVLCPKGRLRVRNRVDLRSRRDWTRWRANWRVVELWKVPAAGLFAASDVGLMPWVPLTNFTETPEQVLQQCRERIDQQALPEEHDNLLAATQVLTRLRLKDSHLLSIFGGRRVMIESPLIQELLAERMHKAIGKFLEGRFGSIPLDLQARLRAVQAEDKLDDLASFAATCGSLDEFRKRLERDTAS